MPPKLLSARELGEQLGISYAEVLRLHRVGRLPSIKAEDGRVYFALGKVVAALRENQQAEAVA